MGSLARDELERHVVVLRTPSEPISEDPYERVLSPLSGVNTTHITTLETTYVNTEALHELVHQKQAEFDGVIITSKRAAQAWVQTVDASPASKEWSSKVYYVVGNPTRDALAKGKTSYQDVRGAGTGTGEKLAHFILGQQEQHKLLYLVGDKNKDTIETILNRAGVATTRLQVYETAISDQFKGQLQKALQRPADETWVVLFAPSVTDAAFEVFGQAKVKLATIGPVTTDHVKQNHRRDVDVEADTPDPTGLLMALRRNWSTSSP